MDASLLHQARSVFRFAVVGFRQSAAAHSLAIGIIALCLTALGAFSVLLLSAERLIARWNSELTVVAFLKPAAVEDDVRPLLAACAQRPGVARVRYVDKQAALERLGPALKEQQGMLGSLEPEMIPTAVEAELKEGTPAEAVEDVGRWLAQSPLVEEVASARDELARLQAAVGALRVALTVLALLMGLVTILVISSTLRLALLARREEMEILQLVGASAAFLRAPFLLEGAAQGVAGALLACGCLAGLHSGVSLRAEQLLGQAFGPVSLIEPPWEVMGVLLVLGAVLGTLGGFLAVARLSGTAAAPAVSP